ncbi:hypothetical protein FRX31_008407 [Thalictrum thalictroides]|uniref:Uncharacterized protein n=1 Tax=Thalictrum thalictroides TaxID=46969 RepID=A0A7J6WX38_THATH|nr:hypothetical protein FRX31_008407 [Thalictrum thalictroides]
MPSPTYLNWKASSKPTNWQAGQDFELFYTEYPTGSVKDAFVATGKCISTACYKSFVQLKATIKD